MESFWALLKRCINGIWVSVEPFHLFRDLDEQAYRWNNRHGNDRDRFLRAIRGVVGKRLTYNQLRGKTLRGKKPGVPPRRKRGALDTNCENDIFHVNSVAAKSCDSCDSSLIDRMGGLSHYGVGAMYCREDDMGPNGAEPSNADIMTVLTRIETEMSGMKTALIGVGTCLHEFLGAMANGNRGSISSEIRRNLERSYKDAGMPLS